MLQAIRSRAGSFIVKVLFGLLIASFAVWGIGDIFRGSNPETIVAKVGDKEITVEQLQKALEPALARLEEAFGRKFDLREAKKSGLVQSLVQGLVEKSLVNQEVSRLGITIADDVIRNAILSDPDFQSPQGQFNRFRFEQLLATNHLTEGEYVARLKTAIPARELLHALTTAATPPPLLVDALYRYQNEKRVAAIAFLPLSAAPKTGPPDPAALQKFYDAHKSLFRAPEYRGFTLASLSPGDLAAHIKIPEEKLKEAYQEERPSLALPERRQVLQILASSEKTAQAAEAALKAGTPFKEVAAKIAKEAPDAVDLGLVAEKELPAPLARAAFALKLKTPSEPIKSPFGWHILEVVKIVPAAQASFAEARAKILARLQGRQAAGQVYKIGEHVDDALAGGLSLAVAAKKFGLKLTTVAAVDNAGRDPKGKTVPLSVPAKQVLKLVFTTEKGRASRIIHLDDGGIFSLAVDKITPPRTKTLAEVRPEASAELAAQERRQAIEKEAAALAASVSQERPLKAAAAAKGIAVTLSAPLGRQGEGQLPQDLIDKLFAAKPGAVVTAMSKEGAYLAELRNVIRPKAAAKGATAALEESLDGALKADLGAEFARSLRRRFPVVIHHRIIDAMF
jgi:peptidyl-prolyl cis-trans isomerase D